MDLPDKKQPLWVFEWVKKFSYSVWQEALVQEIKSKKTRRMFVDIFATGI